VVRFEPSSTEIVFADGTRTGYDLLAGIPPHRAPEAISGSGLGNEAGWIAVDRGTLETSHERVYAIGDVTTIPLANGKLLPRAGVFAHGEGLTVARVVAATLAGRPTPPPFDGMGYCWVEAGAGRAAFAVGEFFAEPDPTLSLRRPGRSWHLGKILFERSWIGDRLERRVAHAGLVAASRLVGLRGTF
jgi:sulfide:quinone oxidoreductase